MKKYKKYISIAGSFLFAATFAILFLKRVINYEEFFLRFQLVNVVYENNLNNFFYALGFCELYLAVSLFFISNKIIKTIFDIAVTFYTVFHATYFGIMYFSDTCIECNYYFGVLNESLQLSVSYLGVLFLIYLFLLRDYYSRPKKSE